MNKRTAVISISAIAAISAIVIYQQIDRDARRINRRLAELKDTLEKSASDGQLRTLAKANRATGFFAPGATITLRPMLSGTIERDQIAALIAQAHSRLERLDISIRDRQLEIEPANGTAVQHFTARASASSGREQERQVSGFKLHWVKTDREWYIKRAEIIETIRAPGRN